MVFGIINLVLGGLGIAANLSCGCCIGAIYGLVSTGMQNMPAADRREIEELWTSAVDIIPGLVLIVFILEPLLSLVLGIFQVWSGIGLVKVRAYGRWTCVVWAMVRILTLALVLYYNIAFLYPGVQRWVPAFEAWQDKQNERMRQAGQQPIQRQNISANFTGNPVADNILPIAFDLLLIGYAVAAMLFMLLPATGSAMADYRYARGEPGARPPGEDGGFEDDFGRQRRYPEEPPGGPPPGDL
jgi:hypothetical protein